jgi:hypothetical protein
MESEKICRQIEFGDGVKMGASAVFRKILQIMRGPIPGLPGTTTNPLHSNTFTKHELMCLGKCINSPIDVHAKSCHWDGKPDNPDAGSSIKGHQGLEGAVISLSRSI